VTKRVLAWVGWALLVSTALWPLLPLLTPHVSVLRGPARLLDGWFDFHCTRDPARTLRVGSVRLAVCARCSGIYWGLAIGALLRKPDVSGRPLLLWMVLAAALMLADVAFEQLGFHPSWPGARIATGLLLAYPCGLRAGAHLVGALHKP
jgi:uncharacterized membrane protein